MTNGGDKVTEFYLYGTGDRIMGEVENIGPGLTRQLIVEVPDGGTYTTACKPGMIGDGIRAPFTVTGSAARSVDTNTKLAEATAGYKRYTTSQIEALVPKTQEFVDAVKAGNVEQAKALFPVARTYWERIEPVAESFGDIDPKIDGREDDERDPGVAFTGFHRLEKDLWVDGLQADSGADRGPADGRHQGPAVAGGHGRADAGADGERRRRSCSTRSRPARSPARRTATRTPTSGTSRRTSRARRPRSPRCVR